MKFFLIALAITVACVVAVVAEDKNRGSYGDWDGRMGGWDGRMGGWDGRYGGQYGRWEGRDGWYARRYGGRREYNDKYDNKNLDEMMSDKKLMQDYCRCMLDQGDCSDGGWQLKCHMREALQDGCRRCSDRQKSGMRRVMGYYMNKENEMWRQMVQKYDPKKTYSGGYEKELRKQ